MIPKFASVNQVLDFLTTPERIDRTERDFSSSPVAEFLWQGIKRREKTATSVD